ncbi:uncharacterized protein METZ01_LOCUS401910 [marine metagenome]|uniref:Uncharacterized protein n=1 Tax=marine metagenome TaxID=408172 RepID=A0A382VR45_9ZZZZ
MFINEKIRLNLAIKHQIALSRTRHEIR